MDLQLCFVKQAEEGYVKSSPKRESEVNGVNEV